MSYFIHDYLEVFAPHAIPALASPACMRHIAASMQRLRTVDGGGFECRLGDDEAHADFAVRLSRRDLASLPTLDQVPVAQRGIWARVRALSDAWQRPGSAIGASATKLWLEFDIDDHADNNDDGPPPSVFLGLGKVPEQARACAAASLELLLEGPRREQASDWVARCFDALPESARVAFVGVLLPRAGQLVNLNFIALPNDGIAPFLRAVGWPGDLDEVAALVAELGAFADRLALSLSFGDGAVMDRIGLECFVDRPEAVPVWARMLEHLVDTGLCTPHMRDATLGWAGVSAVDRSRPNDSNLAKVAALLGDQVVAAFIRRINHLKLSKTSGQRPDVKAYFDFGHVIRSREGAVGASANHAYVGRVRDYYDRFAASIVDTLGTTYQAGMVEGGSYRASNLYLAQRAGITPGMAVLDAGCGTCGPSIDIAEGTADVSIDAITISREQAEIGRAQVSAHALAERVRVHVCDYHELPFHDRSFDVALFFETLGYAYDLPRLFAGVHRVLRPGGGVYIKDTFVREGALTSEEREDLDAHDERYVYRTPQISALVGALKTAGFEIEIVARLHEISTRAYDAAIARHGSGPLATDFGRHHHHTARALPIYFGEIRARKVGLRG